MTNNNAVAQTYLHGHLLDAIKSAPVELIAQKN
jgi:hypothetical protein